MGWTPPTREQEVDVAYALEASPFVDGVFALAVPASAFESADVLPFGVRLRPYTGEALASTHFALFRATDYSVTGRVAYADGTCEPSALFDNGRRLVVEPHERDAARSRFLIRLCENAEAHKQQEAALAEALRRSSWLRGPTSFLLRPVRGRVEPDPFPPAHRTPPTSVAVRPRRQRMLVLDDAASVPHLADVDVVRAHDIWDALAFLQADVDLVLVAMSSKNRRSGEELYALALAMRLPAIHRFVFVSSLYGIAEPAPRSAPNVLVVPRPVTPALLRQLLGRFRRPE